MRPPARSASSSRGEAVKLGESVDVVVVNCVVLLVDDAPSESGNESATVGGAVVPAVVSGGSNA